MAKNEKYKTLENLPLCAAEYIKLVIKKMRYRKKARKEVADELTDHFEEHLKDCKNGAEKEQKAQKLISEFGDPKLLAILMRRAKKRCRPLWRIAIERTCQAIFTLIIFLILYVAWFLTGKPVITTDYIAELNKLVRPSADDSLNAAQLYNKAVESLLDANDVKELLRLDFHDANDGQKELIRHWLAKNESPLALITKGSQLPYCWQKYLSKDPEQSMMTVLLPHLTDYRYITYALCWRVWLNAENGDIDPALRDIETIYRFGRLNKGDKILVEQLVGIAIEGRALKTTRQILDAYKIPSDTLADFQRRLRLLIDNDDFTMNLQVEKLFMLDEIQRCFTESRFGPSHVYLKRLTEISNINNPDIPPGDWLSKIPSSTEDWRILLQVFFTHPNKAESIAMTNALYKFWDENLSKTPAQLKTEQINLQDENRFIGKNNLFFNILAPALGRVNMIAWRIKIDAESTLLIIALFRFKQDTAGYPETPDKLVETGYITKIPIDPFSNKPLAYRKTDADFLLYSFGEDLDDDSGQVARDKEGKIIKFADEGDWVFWPVIKD
jgi:hypothetical protein